MLLCVPFYVLFIGVSILSDRVPNIQTRFAVDENTWPPLSATRFYSSLLKNCEREDTNSEAYVQHLAGLVQLGGINPCITRWTVIN